MPLFEVQHMGVTYSRKGQPFRPFSDVGFTLEPGCIYNLTGPSGSGKSTLLTACARMLKCDSGSMTLAGVDFSQFDPQQWRRRVCLVPQQSTLFPGTVRDNLLFPWTLKINGSTPRPSDAALNALLAQALLTDVSLDHDAAQLSGGQQARVSLLRVFATRPTVLLLDEVEAALDDDSAVAVSQLTRALIDNSMTCLRIRHRAEDGYAFGVYTLADGKMTYRQNPVTDLNRPITASRTAHDTGDLSPLASLPDTPAAPREAAK